MRNLLFGVFLALFGWAAQASSGNAFLTCGDPTSLFGGGDSQPVFLNVTYSPGADAGTPGLFWLGVLAPDQAHGSALTEQGWTNYLGGLYPFQARYDNGLPATITLKIPFPNNAINTNDYVGFQLYIGHGAYTDAAHALVLSRRTTLNRIKPQRVAAGTWNAAYDHDEQFIWSLIQKDMVNNNKYGAVFTIPELNCSVGHGGGMTLPQIGPVPQGQGSWRTESRLLTCAQAHQIPSYGRYINGPNITGVVTPDGWVSRHMGVIVAVANGGWADTPLTADDGHPLGNGGVVESRRVQFDSTTGAILSESAWSTSKVGLCDISNPETYHAP